jgi:hypothetical protein
MKTNVLTSPRIQEFGEELKQQKLLVDLLVMEKQVHPDIDGGHGRLLEVDLFRDIDPNWVLDNVLEMLLHVLLAPRYQLATRSPRREHHLEGFHSKAALQCLHAVAYVVQMAQLHL